MAYYKASFDAAAIKDVLNSMMALKDDTESVINGLLDPDSKIINSDINPSKIFNFDWVTNTAIDRNTGNTCSSDVHILAQSYIPIRPGDYMVDISSGVCCVVCYDTNKNFVTEWNNGLNIVYRENGGSFKIPNGYNISYIRIFVDNPSIPDRLDIINMSTNKSIFLNTPEVISKITKRFLKIAMSNMYNMTTSTIDDSESMHKFEIRRDDNCNEEFNIVQLTAPENNPCESTLTLMLSNEDIAQFVDFSCMKYDDKNDGTVEIVCQSRGQTPLPSFSINFNNGSGGRINKFKVNPDAIPIELTSEGLKVRINNEFTNDGTDDDFIIFNFNDVIKKVFPTTLYYTLHVGETDVVIKNDNIVADKYNSTIDVFTSIYGVLPKTMETNDGVVKMTFDKQNQDMDIKIIIK